MLISLSVLVLGTSLAASGANTQASFEANSALNDKAGDRYEFEYPIRKAAIIGAGVGGLIAYRELKEAGLAVHIYERDGTPGGNWHYTDETPIDAPIPSAPIVVGDFVPQFPPKDVELPYTVEYPNESEEARNEFRLREHRSPKPLWKSLTSNAAAPLQQIRELPWPAGTPWTLPNQLLQRYLRAFASWHEVNNNDNSSDVSYNTRVEHVEKRLNDDGKPVGWTLLLRKLVKTNHDSLKVEWWKEDFDALVVATGRYNAPNVPNILGLPEWNAQFPGRIIHSRQYRVPEPYSNQTVLIVGAAVSGGEIAREVSKYAERVYQSVRPDKSPRPQIPRELLLSRIPHNVSIVPEIKEFLQQSSSDKFKDGKIELVNGTILTGIDRIIFATGFRYSYPFLPQFHNSSYGVHDHAPPDAFQPIVTDGTHLRSLYLDAFYIPDPTLAFINANYGMQSFTHGEFLSVALSKVWTGKADLPSASTLWKWYQEEYVNRKGYGRHFQFLGADKTREALRLYQSWIDESAVKYGGKQIDGLGKDAAQIQDLWIRARFPEFYLVPPSSGNRSLAHGSDHPDEFTNESKGFRRGNDVEFWAREFMYNDYW